MAAKIPVRAVFDGSTATGLSEFQSTEFIALAYGGLGASLSIGSAGQVLKVNAGADALEFGAVEAVLNIDGMTDGSGITIADGDKFAISDGGTEKYVLASQIKSYVVGAGATDITALDIDGATDIGAAIASGDLFIIDDGAGGTNRKTAASRIKTFVADVTLTTAAQSNITSLGTLTTLTVDNIIVNGTNIGHTSDTDAIAIASDGKVTFTQEVIAPSLDISGDVDVDGTLETDALTIGGTTLAETIADTVGAMVTSNTETGITVTYEDGDNTLDFVIGTLNQDTTGTSAKVTVTDSTANTNFPVTFHDESNALLDDTGALRYNPSTGTLLVPNLTVAGTTTQVDTVTMEAANAVVFEGATGDEYETTLSIVDPTADHTQYLINQSGYIPLLAASTTTTISSTPTELNLLDGSSANSVVNSKAVIYGSSGELAGTLSTAAQGNVTSVGTLTSIVIADAGNIGSASDTDAIAIASDGKVTFTQEIVATSLDISGNVDVDGTLETDALTIDGATLAETIADTVGAMVTSNTETGIAVTYEDGDNTLDFVIGTLNQDTSGTADNFTVSANNSTDETVYPIFVDGSSGSQGAESDTGLTYNPSTGLLTSTGFSGNLTGTLQTAAQGNVTSLGTLTALTVDDVAVDGKVITMTGSSSDTAVFTAGTNGTLSIVTTDDAAAAANITITADGTFEVDGTTITLDSGGDIDLNADGGDVFLKDDSTTYGSLTNTSGNLIIKSGTTTALTFSGANATLAGDLTISGDDLTMGTNTSGAALIADGTNFNPVVISGDISINTSGVAAIGSGVIVEADVADNAVTLAKMAGLARGKLIYGDSSGDPTALAVGSADQILTADGTDFSWEDPAAGGAGYFLGGASGATGDTTNGLEDVFRVNSATVDNSCTIASSTNANATGPLTVSSGVTVTVSGVLVVL